MVRQSQQHTRLSPNLSSVTTPLVMENPTYISAPGHQGFPHPTHMLAAVKDKVSPPPYSSHQHSHHHTSVPSYSTAAVVHTQLPTPGLAPKQQQVHVKQQAHYQQQQAPLAPAPFILTYTPTSSKDHCIASHSLADTCTSTSSETSHNKPSTLPLSTGAQSHSTGVQSTLLTSGVHSHSTGVQSTQLSSGSHSHNTGVQSTQLPSGSHSHNTGVQSTQQPSGSHSHNTGVQSTPLPSHHLKELTHPSQSQDGIGQLTFSISRPHMSVSPCPPGSRIPSPSTRVQQLGEMSDPCTVPANKPFAVVSAQPSKGQSNEVCPIPSEGNEKGTSPVSSSVVGPLPGTSKAQPNLKLLERGDGSTHRVLSPGKNDQAASKCALHKGATSVAGTTSHSGSSGSEETLKTITKNIQDAFVESNEKKLMAAFEDAWKKFQANGKKYEHVAQQVRKHGQPVIGDDAHKTAVKVKVVPRPCQHPHASSPVVQPAMTSSRQSPVVSTGASVQLAAAVGTGHAPTSSTGLGAATTFMSSPPPYYVVYTPQPSPHIHITMPSVVPGNMQATHDIQPAQSSSPMFVQQHQPSGSEYALYAAMPGPMPPQPKALVQTGVYFPSPVPAHVPSSSLQHAQHGGGGGPVSQPVLKPTELFLAGHHSPSPGSVSIPTKQASTPNQGIGQPSKVQPSPAPSQKSKPKSVRMCSRCGNEATYLCSGCQQEWYCGRDCQVTTALCFVYIQNIPTPNTGSELLGINCCFPFSSNHGMHTVKIAKHRKLM